MRLGLTCSAYRGTNLAARRALGCCISGAARPLSRRAPVGGQERQRRAGTENVAGSVGLSTALTIAEANRQTQVETCLRLRGRLTDGIMESVADSRLNGDPVQRLASNVNISIRGCAAMIWYRRWTRQALRPAPALPAACLPGSRLMCCWRWACQCRKRSAA